MYRFGIVLFALSSFTARADDDVVVVVNAAVTTTPSRDEVKKLYLGRLRELDGKKVAPVDIEGTASEREEFLQKYIGQAPMLFDRYWTAKSYQDGSKPPKRHPVAAVLSMVASDPGLICYARRSQVAGAAGVRVIDWDK